MSSVFPTKWDFLFATVLLGIDRTTGSFSGSESTPGQQLVAVWTSEEIATEALHIESWELRPIAVRDLLRILPEGIGIAVDPETVSGMTATPAYVVQLRRYLSPFPTGARVSLGDWDDMPAAVREVLGQAAAHHDVEELRAFTYSVDDSPRRGCLAHESPADGDAAAALDRALRAASDSAVLGLASVEVVALADVPAEVRAALGTAHVLHRRRRSRRWRR